MTSSNLLQNSASRLKLQKAKYEAAAVAIRSAQIRAGRSHRGGFYSDPRVIWCVDADFCIYFIGAMNA
jgi:hypothetical protein